MGVSKSTTVTTELHTLFYYAFLSCGQLKLNIAKNLWPWKCVFKTTFRRLTIEKISWKCTHRPL